MNFVFALALFFGGLGFIGLAIASSLAGWVNAGLLAATLRARGLLRLDARLIRTVPRILLASAIMAAVIWGLAHLMPGLMATLLPMVATSLRTMIGMLVVVGAGMAVFGVASLALGAVKLSELAEALKPQRARKALPENTD